MKGFAKSQVMGNLVRDPELRTTGSGKKVASFTIAVNTKGNGDNADFIRCVAWEKTGELIKEHFFKGKAILVDGYLTATKWEKDGQTHETLEVNVRDFYFLGGKNEDVQAPRDTVVTEIEDKPLNLDEIPF